MDKALDFGSRDWGFESLHDHSSVPPVRMLHRSTMFIIFFRYHSLFLQNHIYIYSYVYIYIALDSLEYHWMETIALLRRLNSQHQSKSTVLRRLINSLESIEWMIIMNVSWSFKKKIIITTPVLLAERSFDLRTSGLWAQHASAAPLCCVTAHKSFDQYAFHSEIYGYQW